MKKEEKEARLANHEKYWNLVDKISEVSLDAIDELSVSDVISVLDRVKVTLIQQEMITEIEESQKQSEVDNDSDDEDEIEGEGIPPQAELKIGMPFVNPSEMMEEMKGSIINN